MNEKNGKPFIKLRGKTMEIIKKKFKKKLKLLYLFLMKKNMQLLL
jgi:hypothetical protein